MIFVTYEYCTIVTEKGVHNISNINGSSIQKLSHLFFLDSSLVQKSVYNAVITIYTHMLKKEILVYGENYISSSKVSWMKKTNYFAFHLN